MTADTSCNKTSVEIGRIVGWVYEDELPKSYPYDAMYPYSKVDGVRVFPVYAPSELLFTPDGKFISGGSDGMSLRQYYAGQALAGQDDVLYEITAESIDIPCLMALADAFGFEYGEFVDVQRTL